jgi:peroxiredoxin
VVVIGVDTAESPGTDPLQKAQEFKEKHKLTYPILMDVDGKVREAFNVYGFPTNVLIDREGKVRYIGLGFGAGSLNRMIQELLSP